MIRDLPPAWRVPLLVAGFVSVVAGVLAGLARLGWSVPDFAAAAAGLHAPLMISGFFGTVIGLERAVALRHPGYYLGPLASGLGGIGLAFDLLAGVAPWLLAAGSVVLAAGSLVVFARQRVLFTATLALGALVWLAGNVLWAAGVSLHAVIPWWIAFLVLTIAGERLELSRMLPPSASAEQVFGVLVVALLVAMPMSMAFPGIGQRFYGLVLFGTAAWLLRQDIARRTVKQAGLTRFVAVCLLSGYGWLTVGALVALVADSVAPGSPVYDAFVHAVLLGFVFSMVLGHAPIVFPAVLRVRMPYHPLFYLPVAVLHGSVAARLAGDALGNGPLRGMGGLLNAGALVLFVATMASAAWRGRKTAND